jgi:hypothetical protein
MKTELAREERDLIVAEHEKYGKDIPLIERIKVFENELSERRRSEKISETRCKRLAKDVRMLDNQNIEQSGWLSQSNKELNETKEINEKLTIENRELKLEISNLKGS